MYEAYRAGAESVESPLERALLHCSVDALRATLESMRFLVPIDFHSVDDVGRIRVTYEDSVDDVPSRD